jgi:pyruvate kinase
MIERLIDAGVNVFRLNTSHGKVEEHIETIRRIQTLREKRQLPIGILIDLEGPKIRIGKFQTDSVRLEKGQTFRLTSDDTVGDNSHVSISYKNLPKELKAGDSVMVADGLIELKVLQTDATNIKTVVENGGTLSGHKGVNVPGADIGLEALTEKDKEYIRIAVVERVDYIAQSFVRKPEDIDHCRQEIRKWNGSIPIIAKIETKQALNYLKSILYRSDGVMVARGDLGVEIPAQEVPLMQKKIIGMANMSSKTVITATQMLESMIENPRPTRAEASDIANAIIDGTDAIMLSAETTIGKYPVESVKTMVNIANTVEKNWNEYMPRNIDNQLLKDIYLDNPEEAIANASCNISRQLGIEVIVTSTVTGRTAKMVSKYKPQAILLGVTPEVATYFMLSLVWGVIPMIIPASENTDDMVQKAESKAKEYGFVKKGDNLLLTSGMPWGKSGTTNMLKIHTCT